VFIGSLVRTEKPKFPQILIQRMFPKSFLTSWYLYSRESLIYYNHLQKVTIWSYKNCSNCCPPSPVLPDNNRGKMKYLEKGLSSRFLCPPKISHGLARDSKVSCLSYARPNNWKGRISKYIFVQCPPNPLPEGPQT
jgi:hypothetical protein